ncbi:CDGSH iron-sulfur domain-containing protein [Saccharopolyspora sp. NPDC000359]|uniref:CDGSH iron-sulfur domain-containing protein n=1 Tax=Saccharopolyspora sp. NPDC000359 TaxID=3154251 RepID=UPI003320F288
MPDRSPTRVEITGEGPVLVHGPVDLVLPDGTAVHSERAVTALCTCRRSRRYPMCDTSHRRRTRDRRKDDDGTNRDGQQH